MPHSINRVVLWYSLFPLAAAVAGGCQRGPTWNLAAVEGTVAKDGQPLANVRVLFLADVEAGTAGPRTRGTTDEAGHYRLRTDGGDEGAVAGKYRVLLLDLKAAKERMGHSAGGPQPKEAAQLPPEDAKRPVQQRVPPRYESFSETPLRVEVQSGPQVIDLEVK